MYRPKKIDSNQIIGQMYPKELGSGLGTVCYELQYVVVSTIWWILCEAQQLSFNSKKCMCCVGLPDTFTATSV